MSPFASRTAADAPAPMARDERFVPMPKVAGEEYFVNGIFEFNITQLIAYINDHPTEYAREKVALTDLGSFGIDRLDEQTISKADLEMPVVLAEISPGNYNLIDGRHRVARARRDECKFIWAFRLDARSHTKFLTSIRAYDAFVSYWNEKLAELRSLQGRRVKNI